MKEGVFDFDNEKEKEEFIEDKEKDIENFLKRVRATKELIKRV